MARIQQGNLPVYFSQGSSDLVLFCIHGAGLSSHTFALLSEMALPYISFASYDI